MDDEQVVTYLFGAAVLPAAESLRLKTETFRQYFMEHKAAVSDTLVAKVNLNLSTAEGVQPIKLKLSQFDKKLSRATYILKIMKKGQLRPQPVVESREGSQTSLRRPKLSADT